MRKKQYFVGQLMGGNGVGSGTSSAWIISNDTIVQTVAEPAKPVVSGDTIVS